MFEIEHDIETSLDSDALTVSLSGKPFSGHLSADIIVTMDNAADLSKGNESQMLMTIQSDEGWTKLEAKVNEHLRHWLNRIVEAV